MISEDYHGWTFEGPVYYNGRMDCSCFTATTMARTPDEARRNIIWQYKIKFKYPKNADIELGHGLARYYKLPMDTKQQPKKEKKKKEKPQSQVEQIQWKF